jgi:hypothetical protein
VDLSFYKSFMSEEIRDEGRAQGRTQQGAEFVLAVLDARGIAIPDSARERITSCDDLGLLDQWVRRAATVSAAEEIFLDDSE